ncbi:MAG TPA: flagellin [Methanosarcinales archaeon]|nr:flagellin [Methanosarcinales archaeon]
MKANNRRRVSKDDQAQVGIGTLIIFIAMVLVAAVAAAVLIQTSGVLQQKAQTTGKEATKEISSNIDVDSVEGWRGGSNSSASDMDTFSAELYRLDMRCSLKVGSEPVDMNQVVITITDGTTTNDLRYIYGEINTTDGTDAGRLADSTSLIGTYYRMEVRNGTDDSQEELYYFEKIYPDVNFGSGGTANVIYSDTAETDRIGNRSDMYLFARCDKFYAIEEIRDEDKSFTKDNPVMNTGDLVKVILFTGPNDLDSDLSAAALTNNETMGESTLILTPRTSVAISMIPEGGASTDIDFLTPSSYGVKANMDLYP